MPTFELDRLISYDDEALLAELRRVAALVDLPYLSKSAFDDLSKAHSSVFVRRFGGWQQSLERAGLGDRYSGAPRATRIVGRTFTDDRLLCELRAVSAKIGGRPVTIDVFNQHAEMNAETIRRRFGSWWVALKQAGLAISSQGRRYSDDDYFENLLAVWTQYGRQPTYGQMDNPPSAIPSGAYEAKWGTWKKALLAFLERVNSDTHQAEMEVARAAEMSRRRSISRRRSQIRAKQDEDQRQIKLGLRYDVLKRDRFRCVSCGASPATHLGCMLHVDHVIPWSKGGKTIAENLRTLCEPCNLGKGAKLEAGCG